MSDSVAQAAVTGATGLPAQSTTNWDFTTLATLPQRLDDATLTKVEALATAPLPALPPCDDADLMQCLGILDASLPRQEASSPNGKLRLAAYRRKLAHFPKPTISYLADQALERCRWFPTVSECLDIAAEWKRADEPVRIRAKAEFLARRERQARLDDTRMALRRGELDQDAIDALDDRTKRICEAEMLLWRCDCGSYTSRQDRKPGHESPQRGFSDG